MAAVVLGVSGAGQGVFCPCSSTCVSAGAALAWLFPLAQSIWIMGANALPSVLLQSHPPWKGLLSGCQNTSCAVPGAGVRAMR